ncbi:S-layer homology domain-containing protein [Patescibacteria group bacterium]|nr:S-layer homology domain-containing protein [Patescibacteria group bacterium]MBU1683658.1 S-layer homology domain-containing protein [Patescibacteria group bacterium]MBU1934796.1 S-layer homology domain-containing protein [Patescibacteria group bacterium]
MFGPGKVKFEIRPIYKKREYNKKKNKKSNLVRGFKYAGIGIATVLLMILVYFHQQTGIWFKASILEAPQPFNGTVLPVSKVPDWTHWTGDHYTTHYSEISASNLVDLPNYDLTKMQFPDSQLVWGNSSHDIIRNTKITYPVVYLGNYELDHQENAGSHLAVDIKMPVGTPIHAIANGRVEKVSMEEDSFGHHIVIVHPNVPDPNGGTTTLYSCYVHMDEIHVVEGETVLKGEQIGTSGNTGNSTTPHLHFQIDRMSAPWHPYWPFSWSESQAAGLSFFEAVNAGLGLGNAQNNTINPMNYVTSNLGIYSMASNNTGGIDNPAGNSDNNTDNENQETSDDQENTETNSGDPEIEVIDVNDSSNDQIDTSLFTFSLTGESASLINNGVTITAVDNSNQISQLSDNDEIRVELDGVGNLTKKVFKKSDFNNNTIQIIIKSSEVGIANVTVGKSSHQINFIDQIPQISGFRIDHDGHFQKNTVEVIKVVAVDTNGSIVPAVSFTGTVSLTFKEGSGTLTPDRLSVNNFVNGQATVRVTAPNENDIIIRAQNGALVGESSSISAEDAVVFSDVSKSHPNYEAVRYLYENGVISGYGDGTFKPENTVNRVEALKMLMLAFNVGVGPNGELKFSDTDNSAWYATTLATAVAKEIVRGYDDGTFKPANTVNKAEYLKMIFETNNIELTDSIAANPYADVPKDAWYAPYAYLTNKKNLLDVTNNILDPANGMTRGDVAETIYRLKYVLDNSLVTYSK